MPPKAHRPGLVRNHSHTRTTSGSSSKVALNLHFTQKEPSQPKSDKPKRHSHGQYTANRTTSAVQKSNSTARVSSRDNVAGLAQAPNKAPTTRRASDKSQSTVTNGTKHRAGFTLASSAVGSDDEDDDEWISSESGAATPDKHRDDHTSSGSDDAPVKTPQDTRQDPLRLVLPPPGKLHVNVDGQIQPVAAMTALREDRTPTLPPSPAQQQQQQPPTERRPDKSATLRSPGAGPRPQAVTPTHVDFPTSSPAQLMSSRSAVPLATPRVQPPTPETAKAPRTPSPSPQSQAHSRTQPPTPTSPRPRQQHRSKRTSITRPPSITSDHAPTLRPHPLIRGNSYGLSHLAPLSISSTAAKAQLSASPPSPAGLSRVPASAGPSSSESRFNRRLSTSSTKSSATLPAPSSSTTLVGGGGGTPGSSSGSRKDRTRTLSTLSSGSSAALSSLAHIPIKAPPRRDALAAFPRFPPATATASAAASLHALLPQPYVQPHATVLVWRTPIRESCERVLRAKARNRAG